MATAERITLEWYEVATAAQVGMRRQISSLSRGSRPAYGANDNAGWLEHIQGALGEMAVAKCLGIYWPGSVDTFSAPDLWPNLQVRTRSKPHYELLIRPADADECVFILARGMNDCFDVVGWITGKQAKRPEWRHKHGGRPPAWFIPDEYLYGINSLRGRIRRLEEGT